MLILTIKKNVDLHQIWLHVAYSGFRNQSKMFTCVCITRILQKHDPNQDTSSPCCAPPWHPASFLSKNEIMKS